MHSSNSSWLWCPLPTATDAMSLQNHQLLTPSHHTHATTHITHMTLAKNERQKNIEPPAALKCGTFCLILLPSSQIFSLSALCVVLSLCECTPYTKIGFACKFLPGCEMGQPFAGAGAGADADAAANALRSFCLFDTCVVSDCPYYVTHCVTDEQIEQV